MSETTEGDDGDRADEPSRRRRPTRRPARGSTVMLLGSGELSRELALAFQRLGADVIAVDRYADAPAHGVADRAAVVKMNDAEELTALIEKENPRYVVAEAGVIAADALIAVAERGDIEVFPTPRSTRLSLDREGLRRLAADELGPAHRAVLVRRVGGGADRGGRARGLPAGRQADRGGARRGPVGAAARRGRRAGLAPRRRRGPHPAQPGDGRDGRRGRLRGHAADRPHHRTGGAGACTSASRSATARPTATCWSRGSRSRCRPPRWTRRSRSRRASSTRWAGAACSGWSCWCAATRCTSPTCGPGPYDSGLVTLRSQRLSQFELHARAILGLPSTPS